MKVPPKVIHQRGVINDDACTYNRIILPVRVLFASAFHVKFKFLDGFIEGSVIVEALGLKCVL